MQKYGYTWEKLYATTSTLASSSEPLRKRLANAWMAGASRLQPRDFPPDLHAEFAELCAALTMVQDPERGAINSTCAAMSDEDAHQIAEQIVGLYDKVCAAHYRSFKD